MNQYKIILSILLLGLTSWTITYSIKSTPAVFIPNKLIKAHTALVFKNTISQTYTPHSPILIAENSHFVSQGFLGAGTLENPYRIENLNITASNGDLISISNTTAYFHISDSNLDGLTTATSGVSLSNVQHATLENNIIISNLDGISVFNSSFTVILNNSVYTNTRFGIFLDQAISCTLSVNVVNDNLINGVHLRETSNTTITDNVIYNHWYGEYHYSNILLETSCDNLIANNSLFNSHYGIHLLSSTDNNWIAHNIVQDNLQHGILLEYASGNTILNNTFMANQLYGIRIITGSNENSINFNDFINNNGGAVQADDNGDTNVFIGNYWSDWPAFDADDDECIDNPYPIDGDANNSDLYPLVAINAHVLLPLTVITPNGGEVFSDNISIEWTASADSLGHPVTYAVYYSSDGGESWIPIAFNLKVTSFVWNITEVEPRGSNYLIKIVATDNMELTVEDVSDHPFIMKTKRDGSSDIVFQFIVLSVVLASALSASFYILYRTRGNREETFAQFFQSEKFESLKVFYHKIIVGLENIKNLGLPGLKEVPKLPPAPVDQPYLVEYFPSDIRNDLQSSLKVRTVLTLTEIAYQNPGETNLVQLSKILDLPTSTLSNELKKLEKLGYIEYHVSTKVLEDARHRTYSITPKGVTLLSMLKDALHITITRLKENHSSSTITI
jgi:parallel beta-helix repeat protein